VLSRPAVVKNINSENKPDLPSVALELAQDIGCNLYIMLFVRKIPGLFEFDTIFKDERYKAIGEFQRKQQTAFEFTVNQFVFGDEEPAAIYRRFETGELDPLNGFADTIGANGHKTVMFLRIVPSLYVELTG